MFKHDNQPFKNNTQRLGKEKNITSWDRRVLRKRKLMQNSSYHLINYDAMKGQGQVTSCAGRWIRTPGGGGSVNKAIVKDTESGHLETGHRRGRRSGLCRVRRIRGHERRWGKTLWRTVNKDIVQTVNQDTIEVNQDIVSDGESVVWSLTFNIDLDYYWWVVDSASASVVFFLFFFWGGPFFLEPFTERTHLIHWGNLRGNSAND